MTSPSFAAIQLGSALDDRLKILSRWCNNLLLLGLGFIDRYRWELGNDEFFNESDPSTKQSVNYPLIGPEVLWALQTSSSLRRFVIIGDEFVKVDLMSTKFNWTSLVLACVISSNLTQDDIDNFFINSSHPAFQYYVGESTAEAIAKVSASHANEMIIFESQIAKLPMC